jgi:hypothetical protein
MSRKSIISTKIGLSLCLYESETTVGKLIMHALKIILLLKFRNNVIKKHIFQDVTPNVEAEWLTLLLRIREFPGSNLTWRPAILTEDFRVFLSPSTQILVQYLKN